MSARTKVLLLAALLFLPFLGSRDMWAPDEPRYAQVAQEMVADGHWWHPHRNGREYRDKPPGEREAARDEPSWPPTPPLGTRWRFGAEALVLGANFGIYFNLGELFDFIIGWTTIDIQDDDGYGKGDLYELPPRSAPESEQTVS